VTHAFAEAEDFMRQSESNAQRAAIWLRDVVPGGPWTLTAITPDGPIETQTFTELNDVQLWVQIHDGTRNLYWSVNPLLRSMNKKAEKKDIREVRFLHVDVDPRDGQPIDAERARILRLLTKSLPKGIPLPTVIVDSGSGFQAFWKLAQPIPVNGDVKLAEEAERYNIQLELLFNGDHCRNVDRIMRIVGTMNLPTAAKVAKGRTPVRARLLEKDLTRIYDLKEFKQVSAGVAKAAVAVGVNVDVGAMPRRLADIDELDTLAGEPKAVTARLKVVCVQGEHPDRQKPGDGSRSAWLFDACCNLVRAKVPDDVIFAIITDSDFGISASVLDKGAASTKYALRQIGKAKATVAADEATFQTNDKNVPVANQHNVRVALSKLGVRLRHDQFADRLLIEGLPGHGPTLQDEAVTTLWLRTDSQFGFRPAKDFFGDVVADEARSQGWHPVKEYLDGLEWDGTPRVNDWLSTYGGAEASNYTRAVGALVLIAAVRRVREPGCKFDEVLVLKSEQGKGKSTAVRELLPNGEWFSDDLPIGAEAQAIIERTQGKWIIEAAELKGIRRRGEDVVKAFLSRSADKARMAYGRIAKEALRQFIIIGTTNDQKFLHDTTGNRRWWPVEVERFDLDGLRRDRDQLWAEAAHREAAGESIRLDPALYAVAAEHQEANRVEDPLMDRLCKALCDKHGMELAGKIRSADLWELLNVGGAQSTTELNTRVGNAMRALGWRRTKLRFGGPPEWTYIRGNDEHPRRIVVVREHEGRWVAAYDDQERIPC
jgi:hypothetical protein